MQQKMILQTIDRGEDSPEEIAKQTEPVLLRGLLLAFAAEHMVSAQQVQDAVRRISRETRP